MDLMLKVDKAPGARYRPGIGTEFRIWAPLPETLELELLQPEPRRIALERDERGYATVVCPEVGPGALYRYRVNGGAAFPDPASLAQPEGVHGPSQVVDLSALDWTDGDWRGLPLDQHVFYELHTGTLTPQGTFDAIIGELDRLKDLGITALELMPVAQFPGARNWGYDGVFPFAAQSSYGGVAGLHHLVDACHRRGLAVVLDVVYNHLGPEGNYLGQFAPYFTTRYQTPWGPALNFDGAASDEVRRYFIANALYWLRELHFDALRLDAIHGIVDTSALPFLAELQAAVEQESERLGRRLWLFAESDLNDVRVLRSPEEGGFGMPAQWNDDFHHALHVELTGERGGYYLDYTGLEDLATALRNGFVYSGQYSRHRQRRHGNSSRGFDAGRFVVFAQNHDQIGNRAQGDRLSKQLDLEALKLSAGVLLLSPFLPLLFMGEEYGETAPFPYFTSHGDRELAEAVRRGRAQEFAAFRWMGEVPDPQSEQTFAQARLSPELRRQPRHQALERLYRRLLQLRRELPALAHLTQEGVHVEAHPAERLLVLRRSQGDSHLLALFHFGDHPLQTELAVPEGAWEMLLDSAAGEWMGPNGTAPQVLVGGAAPVQLPARSFVAYGQGSHGYDFPENTRTSR